MMHFHEDHEEFQGKTPKQIDDSFRMMMLCLIVLIISAIGMIATVLLQ